MKRSWFGFGLLAVLLVVCLGAGCLTARACAPTLRAVTQAEAFGRGEDWDKALPWLRQARQQWEESRPLAACVADQTPMEEIDGLFAQLAGYAGAEEATEFSATCLLLTEKLQAFQDAQSLRWWYLL